MISLSKLQQLLNFKDPYKILLHAKTHYDIVHIQHVFKRELFHILSFL